MEASVRIGGSTGVRVCGGVAVRATTAQDEVGIAATAATQASRFFIVANATFTFCRIDQCARIVTLTFSAREL